MGTDTVTRPDPWPILTALLANIDAGKHWSSADWHEESTALHPNQVIAAQKRAVTEGYLEPVGQWIDGEWSPNMVRARHIEAVGRWVTLYKRTALPLPGQTVEHAMPGQLALVEVGA